VIVTACGDAAGSTTLTSFEGFDGCQAGADSVIVFLQRTLDDIGDAEPADLDSLAAPFDEGVDALLLRAQEVHCTEQGFNQAIMLRVGDLVAGGSAGELLIAEVAERGLGSREESRGGPVRLPTSG
jgi:hypothetical protein